MFKVLATAVLTANLLFFSRYWQPARGKGVYQGIRGGLLGCMLACFLASLLAWAFPGPYRLAIYTLGLNLLLTPTLATAGVIWGIGLKPKKKPESRKKKSEPARELPRDGPVETPAFSEVMAQVAGSHEAPCEETL
ncbi:MAG: hypothetical protein KF760_01670 [Candidatus Eremiobacteraeota bacterium]|nr:hypothetical protein [Candidatus Eremiobacteraeota bacterium]MCW5872734.1 hypothetical protein [Candidatus Eremiobacteraeota bacterium]